jgi:hypothetical protein
MKSYIKLTEIKSLPDSSIQKRQLSDDVWKNYIFFIILKYYKDINKNEVFLLIQKEILTKPHQIEKKLKEHIYDWYKQVNKSDKQIGIWGFILNLESSSEGFEGFYDLKFQHSDWNKYFVFEAKNLGEIKSIKYSTSINEYVCANGMFRFITNKYARDINFGGILGFVVGNTTDDIIKRLTGKIKFIYENSDDGKLTRKEIIFNSIAGNLNTFDTIHLRKNYITQLEEEFCLHHIIMVFT